MSETVEEAIFHISPIMRAERALHSGAASYCEAKRNNGSSSGGIFMKRASHLEALCGDAAKHEAFCCAKHEAKPDGFI